MRQVCMNATLCSTMFVPDRMYPEYLSAAIVALGPPRHTLFLPVPMGASALPAPLADSRWGTKALQLADKLSIDHSFVKEFEAVEKKFIKEFYDTREKARKLLIEGKRAQAVLQLDTLLRKQFAEANSCFDAVAKKAAPSAATGKNEVKNAKDVNKKGNLRK